MMVIGNLEKNSSASIVCKSYDIISLRMRCKLLPENYNLQSIINVGPDDIMKPIIGWMRFFLQNMVLFAHPSTALFIIGGIFFRILASEAGISGMDK